MNEKKTIFSETRPETRLQKSMRGVLRWVLVVLLAFGFGALVITFALYLPTRQKLEKANTDLEHTSMVHISVLKALAGARGASLAVATDDHAGALQSLTQTSEALDALSGLLGTNQKDVLTAMQQSTAQALTDLKTDLKSAQPELDQLTKNLVQLEDNLFPNP